jgi:hypothetical protein
MKIFKFMAIALVAMFGFTACDNECEHELNKACEHEFIEVDYSKALVGTWTCMDMDYAEALVIKADGSVEVTGVVDGEYFESKGTIKVVNNKMTYTLDNGDEWEGRFEMIVGESFTMVLSDELDIRYTYRYCENDLSDEIVGMWVCNEGLPGVENDMAIKTYTENGKMAMTTQASAFMNKDLINVESDYKVIGNLLFIMLPKHNVTEGKTPYLASQLTYIPDGTSLGDILTEKLYVAFNNGDVIYSTASFLRVKQTLDFNDKKYAYKSAYVSNAEGANEDFSMMGSTFNIANIEGGDFDVIFGDDLYLVELNAGSIKHKFRPNGQDVEVVTPFTVEGNKVTLDMSAVNSACRKVEMYMFQDKDNSQLHMYMPTGSFINYFANLGLPDEIAEGRIDPTDDDAIEKFYTDMEARIKSINVSFVFKVIE